jgi:hypothetical protein
MWGRIGQRERAHARAEGSGSGALGSLEQRSGHLVTKGTAAFKTADGGRNRHFAITQRP